MCLLSFVYRTAKIFRKSKTVSLFSSSSLFTRKIAPITAAMAASSSAAIFVTQCLLVSGPRISTGVFLCRQSELFLAFRANHSYSRIVDKKTRPKSYLSNRSQRISISGTLSRCFNLDCGVPQGSCLGPLLFVNYSSQLFDVIEKHVLCVHCFADDNQLYLCLKPDGQVRQDVAMRAMERCIADIRSWMINDRLLLNDGKTEVLLIGTQYQLNKLDRDS